MLLDQTAPFVLFKLFFHIAFSFLEQFDCPNMYFQNSIKVMSLVFLWIKTVKVYFVHKRLFILAFAFFFSAIGLIQRVFPNWIKAMSLFLIKQCTFPL